MTERKNKKKSEPSTKESIYDRIIGRGYIETNGMTTDEEVKRAKASDKDNLHGKKKE